MVLNIKLFELGFSFFNSRVGIAVVSTLLLPFVFLFIGKVLDAIVMAIYELISGFLGDSVTHFLINEFLFIGTMHHELSHALLAFLTGAKIEKIELYNPHDRTLGSVSYYTRNNRVLASLENVLASSAPVFCGYITLNLLFKFINPMLLSGWKKFFFWYVAIAIFSHMTMSSQDIKVALKGLPICLMFIFIIVYITQFNILIYLQNLFGIIVSFAKGVI